MRVKTQLLFIRNASNGRVYTVLRVSFNPKKLFRYNEWINLFDRAREVWNRKKLRIRSLPKKLTE